MKLLDIFWSLDKDAFTQSLLEQFQYFITNIKEKMEKNEKQVYEDNGWSYPTSCLVILNSNDEFKNVMTSFV